MFCCRGVSETRETRIARHSICERLQVCLTDIGLSAQSVICESVVCISDKPGPSNALGLPPTSVASLSTGILTRHTTARSRGVRLADGLCRADPLSILLGQRIIRIGLESLCTVTGVPWSRMSDSRGLGIEKLQVVGGAWCRIESKGPSQRRAFCLDAMPLPSVE